MAEPTPIVRIITRLNVGGPSLQATSLSDLLTDRGFRTSLIHGSLGPGEGDMTYLLEGTRASVLYLPSLQRQISPRADVITLARIFAVLRQTRPAILHTHMAKAGTLGRMAAIAYNSTVGASRRIKLVHTYHGHVLDGYFSPRRTAAFLAVERVLARFTDTIVAISPQIQSELLQLGIGRAAQYAVVPLGFELTPFAAISDEDRRRARQSLGLPADAPVVTFVGRLTAIKQPELFVQMAALVASRHPATRFLIVGDGELRGDVESAIAGRGLAGSVQLLGWRQDLPCIYAASDVVVLTSLNEGTPVALIEALASGVSVVSTDVGGVRDVVDEGKTGLRVPRGDADRLADAVVLMIERPEERRRMGAAGREAVTVRYALDRLVSDIASLYRRLTQEHTR